MYEDTDRILFKESQFGARMAFSYLWTLKNDLTRELGWPDFVTEQEND